MTIVTSTILKTKYGKFMVCYHEYGKKFCLSFSKGDLSKNYPIVRIHSACLFAEVFGSIHCDCYIQLKKIINLIKKNKNGVIIYSFKEGRGIGLKNKIKTMELERVYDLDTVDAFRKLGFNKKDYRSYTTEIRAMKELNINRNIKSSSRNPVKINALKRAGYNIDIISENNKNLSKLAKRGIVAKIKKLGYKN